jgi:hypothetical protein
MLGFTGDHEIRRNRFNKNPPDLLTSCSKTADHFRLRRTKALQEVFEDKQLTSASTAW